MTTIVVEIYEALKKAGIDEETAKIAAKAVVGTEEKEHLATKADLHQLEAKIQAMLNRHLQIVIGAMVALTAIFSLIVKL